MKRTTIPTAGAKVTLLCGLVSGVAGCNHELAAQVATWSSAYLGDVVTVLANSYLHDALGIEAAGSADEHAHGDEHSHDADPLHDHEH